METIVFRAIVICLFVCLCICLFIYFFCTKPDPFFLFLENDLEYGKKKSMKTYSHFASLFLMKIFLECVSWQGAT